jgi:hypothetical protein
MAAMHIEATARKVGMVIGVTTALVGAASAVGSAMGGKYLGPGERLDSLDQEVRAIRDTLHLHDRETVEFRDSLKLVMEKGFAPMNIFLCLNVAPKDTAMMQLDCDAIVGSARNAAIMRDNDRAFARPSWKAKP